ncbi:hypothetical protein K432DRAFT_407543 [Lepidopterella palustris CBS 459.81]|uniref:Uncharacterized protein n=1 Tax=Lepidopterella palustris CBS 459.81 TaxID=1314670 RepID=A0A8E2E4Q9_9PEZI|nr:hypothetical protein K432DRAFT_407543 [Lepidopterella palustris CBS 459.81]
MVYIGLTINGSQYIYDLSGLPTQLAVTFPNGAKLVMDDSGLHTYTSDCSQEIDVLVPNFFEQLNQSSVTVANLDKRNAPLYKRLETSFQVNLQLTDQCGNRVTSQSNFFNSTALALGNSACSLLASPQTDPAIGVWAWNCLYPGLNSRKGQCETAAAAAIKTFDHEISTISTILFVANRYLTYGAIYGLFVWNPLVPILLTGVAGIAKVMLLPSQIPNIIDGYGIGSIRTPGLGVDNVATFICQHLERANDAPYQLQFAPQVGAPIPFVSLIAAPVYVLNYPLTITNTKEAASCNVTPTCQPSAAEINAAWEEPCNVLVNPSFDSYDNEPIYDQSNPWYLGVNYQNTWFGKGGPNGDIPCTSGLNCYTIETQDNTGWSYLGQIINITSLQNGSYVMSADIMAYNITVPVNPGNPTTGCNISFDIFWETSTPPPAMTYYAPTTTYDTLSSQVNIAFWIDYDLINSPASMGLISVYSWDPAFYIIIGCGSGVTGTFIIDNVSVCLADSLCAKSSPKRRFVVG